MIDALVADAVFLKEGGIRASCGHFSLALETPHRDAEELLSKDGDNVVVFTVLEIEGERISTPVLVGLSSEERRDMYGVLRSLKGIGRRSALAILDAGEILDILRAAAAEDESLFRTVPGLGTKRIEAIHETLKKAYHGAMPKPLPLAVADWVTIRETLTERGLSDGEAEERIMNSSLQGSAEELLKEILP